MKSLVILSAAIAFGLPIAAQAAEHRLTAAEGLADITPQLKPGDEIVIADGRHANWVMTVTANGTAASPIVIRSATPGKAVFTGKSKLVIKGAEHVVVRDLAFDACKVTNKSIILLEGAKNCRVTECRFLNSHGKKNDQVVRVTAKGPDNRVDHCTFIGNEARGVQIHLDAETVKTDGYPIGTRIDHNLFQDVPTEKHGGGAANGRETIQVGHGGTADCLPKTIVEYNIFLRCNGENECISNKTSGNTYRFNSFKDQGGCMSLRGASGCVVEGNRFENTPGIHVQGSGHKVVNNLIIRCGGDRKPGKQGVAGNIVLGYGMERRPDSEFPQHYHAAEECLVANNTIVDPPMYGLVIGGGKGQDWKAKGLRNVPPSHNRIVNNLIVGQTGELMIQDDAPDNVVDHNLICAAGQATVPAYGTNPIKTSPQFRNAAAGDYRLAAGSPGLKAGLALPEVPNSADIGATAEPVGCGPGTPVDSASR